MLKSTATFKLKKTTKTMLALGKFRDAHDRGQWKRAMIDAQLNAQHQPKIAKGRDNKE
jgi:hypothetical protein